MQLPSLCCVQRPRKLFFILLASVLLVFIVYILLNNSFGTLAISLLDSSRASESDDFLLGDETLNQQTNNIPELNSSSPVLFKGPQNKEQEAIVRAFLHAWNSYKRYAWGHDELKPISKGWIDWLGIGLTIVDSLDTMWIMGLKDEFSTARDWVASNLSFKRNADVQLFEVVIRGLAGLLSAYHLSEDKVFLTKAVELGNALLPCLKGQNGIPCNRINLQNGFTTFSDISTAEVGTIQLELRDLSRSIRNKVFERAALDISHLLHQLEKFDGLVATFLDENARFKPLSSISVGANADSYYEYLLKQWIQTGKTHVWFKEDYLKSVDGIKKHLLQYSGRRGFAYVGSYSNWESKVFHSEMEHLACFLPGTLALGVFHGLDQSHLEIAANLTATCYAMYEQMATGLSPDIVDLNTSLDSDKDFSIPLNMCYNIQRPETVESIYYMYHVSGEQKYRDWGWKIFQAFEKYSKVDGGYACVDNVNSTEPMHRDKMESFFLAETLKYLYLLFSNSTDIFENFIFNTEAHPLPIYKS